MADLFTQLARATDELNRLHADVASLRRARDDARRQRDCEAERADRLLEQRDAAVRTRNAVADSVAKLKAAHRRELDTLQARLTVAAQEIERLRAIPDLTDEERAAFLGASEDPGRRNRTANSPAPGLATREWPVAGFGPPVLERRRLSEGS